MKDLIYKFKTSYYTSLLLLLLSIILGMFVIQDNNGPFSYLLYAAYCMISFWIILIIIRRDIFNLAGKILHAILIVFLVFQCFYSCFNVFFFSQKNTIETYSTYMGPLIYLQKVYTIAYLLIAVISIFISFLLKNTKAKDLLFVRIVTIAYFVFYITGQVLLCFHQNIAIMQISNFINTYILEVFPVIYYLSLFKFNSSL